MISLKFSFTALLVLITLLSNSLASKCTFNGIDLSSLSKANGTSLLTPAGTVYLNPCELATVEYNDQILAAHCILKDHQGNLHNCGSRVKYTDPPLKYQGVRVVFSEGLECTGPSPMLVDLGVFCWNGVSTLTVKDNSIHPSSCSPSNTVWKIEWLTRVACPIRTVSFCSKFFFFFLFVAVAYFGGGYAYSLTFTEKRGLKALPNCEFWCKMMEKLAELFGFLLSKVRRRHYTQV
ncbi:hypothetical protein RCL1_002701 [Eukaryota sp. TZLM3-RCL]